MAENGTNNVSEDEGQLGNQKLVYCGFSLRRVENIAKELVVQNYAFAVS